MKKIFIFIISILILISLATALNHANIVSTCSAENNAAKGSFATACDVPTGASLQFDDTSLETQTYRKSTYGGVRIQSVNTTVTNCNAVSDVFICYKWWRTATATPQDCDISVDANAGASYTAVTTTCPATAEPTGVTCTNVTTLETWTCANFFGSTGTRAIAKSEISRVGTGAATTETATWDVLFFNVTYTTSNAPTIDNITASHSTIKGGNILTIYANTTDNGVNDTEQSSLSLYCDSTNTPTSANTDCTGGTTTDADYPYILTCTFATALTNQANLEYCRVYDGTSYSLPVNITYITDSTAPTTSLISVAGDTTASYFDTLNNGLTEILFTGENNMSCRWSNVDVIYSSMSNDCTINGTQGNCTIDNIASQAFHTRYISCQDFYGNEQTTSQNLDVSFYLDYTAPTTTSNAVSSFQAPPYVVTITELDNVDADPTTYYCTSSTAGCSPTTLIDNGGTITYTSASRGVNYLRYYSIDDAGNTQVVENRTININYLPTLLTAEDDSTIIKGGAPVNVSTNSSDVDSGQLISLFVCSTNSATATGCTSTEYCSSSGTGNLTCNFTSETDSAIHNWYAFIFDEKTEGAVNNSISGSYTTDSTAPVITLANPLSASTITQNSVTITMILSEPLTNGWYSLDSGVNNISMSNISLYLYTHSNTSITNGNYNLSIWANDSSGNIGSLLGNSFTINVAGATDATPPAITILTPANASYNSLSPLVNITTDEALSWAGYKLNGGVLTNLTSATTTNWYTTLSLSQEYTNNLTIYANDTSNNQNNKTITIYADTLAPRYSNAQASPSPANVSQNVNCSITFTDGFNIASVKISENSAGTQENHTISFSGTSGSASYVIVGSRLTNPGDYQCIFYAQDTAGNSNSTSVSFNVNDITAPTITVTSPTNEGTYNQLSVPLSLVTSEAASSAWYSLDGAANVTMGNTSSTSWNYTLTGLTSVHTYSVIFYANDSSGNLGISSSVSFTINTGLTDTIPPVLTLTIANASYKTSDNLQFNVSSNENLNWSGYKLNSGDLVSLTNISAILWNGTLSGLGNESTNILLIYGNDSVNNQGNSTITFYVDTVAPRFLNVSAIPSVANETQSVVCNVYVNDTFGLGSIKIGENATISGTFLNHTIDLSSAGWANYTITNVQKGGYNCIFYATDAAGNSNSTSVAFAVNDVTPPVISINSPLNQSYSTNSILLSITSNEDLVSANYSLDNGFTNVSLTGSGKSWSKTVSFTDGSKNLIFYGIDNSGNLGTASVTFTVDISVNDITSPSITIWSPQNNTYYSSTSTLINISSDESLKWAGYKLNSGVLTNLDNYSLTNWNITLIQTESQYNLTIFANDTSNNQANTSIFYYVDTNNPQVIFSCNSSINDSLDVTCNGTITDTIGLDYYIISQNSSGIFVNTSLIDISGISNTFSYILNSANTTPGEFFFQLFAYDLSGRINGTELYKITVNDDTFPEIYNITYYPNTTDDIDPSTTINVNATIIEDYNFTSVVLMYRNLTDNVWIYQSMDNNSAYTLNGASSIVFNASFIARNNTWQFKINVTDTAGNQNISSTTTIVAQNDTSFFNSTSIPNVKSITYAQRVDNNTLGYLFLNNTGDNELTLDINVSSSLRTRFNINYTISPNASYTLASTNSTNLTIFFNSTGLTAGIYNYNLSINSSAGYTILEKQINIQTADGPYLQISIDTFSSSVTKGQTAVSFSVTTTNLGTADAENVYLNWTLPSQFTLASGSLSRNFSSLPISSSATNTITIDVSSSASLVNVLMSALSYADGLSQINTSKTVSILDPVTLTQTVTGTTTSSGGGGGGGASSTKTTEYDKTVRITRGDSDSFELVIENKYYDSYKNVKIRLSGFPEQYVSISPSVIDEIKKGESKFFKITINPPEYQSYQKYDLTATVTGVLTDLQESSNFKEVHNIQLIIQEIDDKKTNEKISEAEEAIRLMKEKGYNIESAELILEQMYSRIDEEKNKEAFDLAEKILEIKKNSEYTDNLLRRIVEASLNPKKSTLVIGNSIKLFESQYNSLSLKELIGENSIFSNQEVKNLVGLAISAFERGDYATAQKRAEEARSILLLSQKGNLLIFMYLYWHYLLLSALILLPISNIGFNIYRRKVINSNISNLNKEEKNIQNLLIRLQEKYFSGNMSVSEYNRSLELHQRRLAKIKKDRSTLRNRRIKLIGKDEILQSLSTETREIESNIKLIQKAFYIENKIASKTYELQFKILNERLAEIEGERSTIDLMARSGKK
jgi:hypothetical protein